jgi:hypothetical protein
MALAGLVVLMPGGIVFLIAWAFGRAYAARLKEAHGATEGRARSVVRAFTSICAHDIVREVRAVSGLPSLMANGR